VNTEEANRFGTLPTAPAIRKTCLLVLLGMALLAITIRFDTQALQGAAPWWAVWLGYGPACLYMGLAGMAAFLVIVSPRLQTM
jgi:hypothetical protein